MNYWCGRSVVGGHKGLFEKIISLENLLAAWKEFKRGKTRKSDVQEFYSTLEENIFEIHKALAGKTYQSSAYVSFYICDPKLRHIHKASVRDRVVHQAIFRVLYPIFDTQFINDSYSCRDGKGTHRGVRQLQRYARKVTANHTREAFALKCDVKKFFSSVDHATLIRLLRRHVRDDETLWLLQKIIASYEPEPGKGLPLGNVTSQLFANIYLNELDQWAKHSLKARYYLRYCDDFIVLHESRDYLASSIPSIKYFLANNLHLTLHPNKIILRKVRQGVDFLGYVVLPHAVMLRTRTKRRMLKRLSPKNLQSYLGVLTHANARKLREKILSK